MLGQQRTCEFVKVVGPISGRTPLPPAQMLDRMVRCRFGLLQPSLHHLLAECGVECNPLSNAVGFIVSGD
jgi:hypothetical protein